MTIITLTTDFGQVDGYAGVIKGVILGLAPSAELVDLSHEIRPQDVGQAAHVLAAAMPYFPTATIHLVVVDPGVGTSRRPLLVQTSTAFFLGPDNGVLTPALLDATARCGQLTHPEFWLPEIGATFHGRDIFAPSAAHLAQGVSPEAMTDPISDPVRLDLPAPMRLLDESVRGEVVYIDRFGNLITNIPGHWLLRDAGVTRWRCFVAGQEVPGPLRTYSEVPQGEPVALVSSAGMLEIAVRDGSAERVLGVGPGGIVVLWPA